jgi:hypothetical protein
MVKYIFFSIVLLSCKTNCNKWKNGNVTLNYSLPIKLGDKIIDSFENQKTHKTITDEDSLSLRFFSNFDSTDISIYFSCTNLYKKMNDVTTNKSIMFANEIINIPKNENKIIVVINGVAYEIFIHKEYKYIDIFYDESSKTLNAKFNNTILILS